MYFIEETYRDLTVTGESENIHKMSLLKNDVHKAKFHYVMKYQNGDIEINY